jgi:predicted enzyme related to lactoylglutathione lyase/tetratricopeptide (TPR) repeat protein
MPPERANGAEADVQSDVFALGVILGEVLAGTLPMDERPMPPRALSLVETFDKTDREATAERRESNAESLRQRLAGELDWICRCATHADRTLRYESAAAMGRDLRRWLAGEPVEAGPDTVWYRGRKWVARNRRRAVLLGVLALTIAAGLVASGVGFARARHHEQIASRNEAEAKRLLELMQSTLVATAVNPQGEATGVRALLDDLRREVRDADAEPTLLRADLLTSLATAYNDLEDGESAKELAREAAAIRRDRLGLDHPLTITSLDEYAEGLHRSGKHEAALDVQRELVEATTRLWGPEDERTLAHLVSLTYQQSFVHRHADVDDIEHQASTSPPMESVLERVRQVLGDEHEVTLFSMHTVAWVKRQQGADFSNFTLPESIDAYLAKRPDDPRYLSERSKRAFVEAEALYREVVAGRRVARGETDLHTLDSQRKHADVLVFLGRYAEAEPIYRDTLGEAIPTRGMDHMSLDASLLGLAACLAARDALDEFDPILERRQQAMLATDEVNSGVFRVLNTTAELCFYVGRLDLAEPLLRRSLEVAEAIGTIDPRAVLRLRWMLLAATDGFAAAERAVEEAFVAAKSDKERQGILDRKAELLLWQLDFEGCWAVIEHRAETYGGQLRLPLPMLQGPILLRRAVEETALGTTSERKSSRGDLANQSLFRATASDWHNLCGPRSSLTSVTAIRLFCWRSAARRFFGDVFGWSFTDYGPSFAAADAGIDGCFEQVETLPPKGPVLFVLHAADLEATQPKIESAGGTIVLPTFDFPGGRRFHFSDPSGSELAVWSE